MPLTLTAFGLVVGLGFGAFILGSLFGYTGVAVIGGCIVIAAGGMVVNDGLAVQTGEVRVENSTTNTTDVEYQYDELEEPTHFSLGPITVLLGGVLIIQQLREAGV